MIAKLRGIIDTIFDDRFLLDVNGIFYEILCSTETISNISINQDIIIWIEHIIREDSQVLCGFLTYEEKLWFRAITSVQGIGPKVALAIFSTLKINEVASAISNKTPSVLTRANGIGNRVAERIVSELKNSKLLTEQNILNIDPKQLEIENEVIYALIALGYDRASARGIVAKTTGNSTEERLKAALLLVKP
jgi:Holliday junction DNA helicase RuvA